MDGKIQVVGLAEFNRALRRMDAEAPKQLRLVQNDAAGLLIRRTAPSIPRRSGAAARSLVARSTRTSTRVAVGGRRAPYYPWLDFGGRTGPGGATVREFITEGRYLYPTLRRHRPEIADLLQGGLIAVAESAGLEVT